MSVYVNKGQKATSATVLTEDKLQSWYNKYIGVSDIYDPYNFQAIYQDSYLKYANMIDYGAFYWVLGTSGRSDYNGTFKFVNNQSMLEAGDYTPYNKDPYGLRILITLSSDVKITKEKVGTKTLTEGNMTTHGGDQTYNVWNIK